MKKRRFFSLLCTLAFMVSFLLLPLCQPASAETNPYCDATNVLKPGSETEFALAYDDPEVFIESIDPNYFPKNILLPKSVSAIGTFHMIIDNNGERVPGAFYQYYFVIIPHNEKGHIYLEVDHLNPFVLEEDRMVMDISYASESMATLRIGQWVENPRAIIRDEITYLYTGRFLTAVSWQNGDTAFSIRLVYGDQIGKTDYAEGSFMNALLSLDEEKFDYARDILLSLGAEQEENPNTGDDSVVWLVCMPVCFVGMVVVLASKKRRAQG